MTGSMLCPACHVALTMSERQGVEIDYCPQCRGVWLDRGELDKIIERSAGALAAPSPPPNNMPSYRPDRGSDAYYRPKRKKSFLEELFD